MCVRASVVVDWCVCVCAGGVLDTSCVHLCLVVRGPATCKYSSLKMEPTGQTT